MKRKWKQILSVILSVAMVASTAGIAPAKEVQAAGEQKVTLSYESGGAGGAFTFSHSELSDEYQGINAGWHPVRYQMDAYIDGARQPQKIWIEFVGEPAYTWGGGNFPNNTVPTTSLHILEGTVLYEYDVDNGITVADGKTMVLSEGFKVVCQDGVWKQVEDKPVDVALTFSNIDENNWWIFNHTELPVEYQGTGNWSNIANQRYQFSAYVDGSEELSTGWLEFDGDIVRIYPGAFPGEKAPVSSLLIPKGIVMQQYDPDAGETIPAGNRLTLTEEINLVNRDGAWVADEILDVTMTLDTTTENGVDGAFTFNHTELPDEYQGNYDQWQVIRYQVDVYIDGSDETTSVWIQFVGDKAWIYGNLHYEGSNIPTTSMYIPAGTLLKECTYDEELGVNLTPGGRKLKLAEDVKLQIDENGSWNPNATFDTEYDIVASGTSEYKILIPAKATDNELFAAQELQFFVEEATGVRLSIQKEGNGALPGKFLSVGNTKASREADVKPSYEAVKSNGFVIRTIEDDCYIKGYSDMGTRNGVYEWLERCFGYTYYAPDVYKLNETENKKLPGFDLTVTPSFEYRQSTGETLQNPEDAYRMRFNFSDEIFVTGLAFHNSFNIIDPEGAYDYTSSKYKDWYSETICNNNSRDDRELPAQLCYSNEEMKAEYIKNLKTILADSNEEQMMLGMEDNNYWCTCSECTAKKNTYGTNAAVMIQFANAVQEEISSWYQTEYPDREPVSLVVFAYHQCEQPPVKMNNETGTYEPIDESVRLHEDLGIMFAPVRASYAYSLNDSINSVFKERLNAWDVLTDNLYTWTYASYTADPFIFFDTFGIMKENYQLLLESGSKFIYDETIGYNKNGNPAWERAKAYVMSELQWNINQDVDKLLEDFFDNYFKDASDIMMSLMEYNSNHIKNDIYPKLKYTAPTDDNYTTVRGNIFVPILEKYERYYASKSYLSGAFDKIDDAYESIEKYKYDNPELYEQLYERILLESMQFQYVNALTSQGIFDYWDKEGTEEKWNFRVNFERLDLERIRSTWSAKELFTEIWEIPEYNQVEIDFAKILPTGQICLTGEMISGPDADGSTIGEVYGDWVRYYGEISFEVDGKVIKEQVGIDTMVNTNADYNYASFYVESDYIKNNLEQIDSIKISAGTMITQDSSKTANYSGVKVPICIENTLQVAKIDDEWQEYNEMEVSFVKDADGFMYLNGKIVSGPNEGQSMKDAYGDWATTMSGPIAYTKGGTEVDGEAYWDLFNTSMWDYNANIYLRCDDIKANFNNVSKVTIKKGTILEVYHQTQADVTVYPIKLANDLVLDKKGGSTWAQEYNKVELTYDSYVAGQGVFLNAEIVAGPDAGKKIEEVYGHWVDAAIGAVTYTKDGYAATTKVYWSSCNDTGKKSQFYIWGEYDGLRISELDRIEIFAGEVIIPTASGYSKTPIQIENTLRIGPTDDGWSDENHVELSYVNFDGSFDGRGFYLKADIVGGPDTGADYGQIYGDWKNAPMGEVTYIRGGEEQKMSVSWSSVGGGQIYVIGDYYLHVDEITEFIFPKDTVLTPTSPDYCQEKTRIVNKLHLVKTSDGWVTYEEEPIVTEITLSNDTINGARDTKVICMNATTDPLEWGNYSQKAFVYKDSDGESRRHGGIMVNGEYPESVILIKKWDNYWAIDLSGIISTLEYGSVVTLEGTLRSDKYYAVFNKMTYIYNVDGSFSMYDENAEVVENEDVALPEVWVNIDKYTTYDAQSATLLKNGTVETYIDGQKVENAILSTIGTYEITRIVQNAVKAEVVGSQPKQITYEQIVHLYKTGDTNGDGDIKASDLVRTLKNAGKTQKGGSDLNGDGIVNKTDKDLLADLLVGKKTIEDIYNSSEDVAIGAVSDLHYMATGRDGQNRINTIKALNYYKSQNVDVIIFNADITDYGEELAYQELVEDIKSVYPNEETRPTMIFTGDNHEWYDVWTVNGHTPVQGETFYTLQERFNTQLSSLRDGLEDANSHYVVGGYHLIGVSSDGMNGGYATYDEETLTWLEERLEEAKAADPTKPIFLALHQAPKDTVVSSDKEHYDSAEMDALLEQYPQLVIITSHTHKPVSDEQSIFHGTYTVLNTASLYTGAIGSTDNSLMSDKYQFAQGLLIRANGNKVDVERCDFYNDEKIEENWEFTVGDNS